VACGGTKGSGVDRNKSLGDLDEAEKQKLCDSFRDTTAEKLPPELSCRASGIQAGATALANLKDPEAPCQEALDACVQEQDSSITCDEDTISDFPTCDATVGEVEDCALDTLDSGAARLNALPTCDKLKEFILNADQDEIDEISAPFEAPKSCDKVPEDCGFSL